jgi:hypothetical protein
MSGKCSSAGAPGRRVGSECPQSGEQGHVGCSADSGLIGQTEPLWPSESGSRDGCAARPGPARSGPGGAAHATAPGPDLAGGCGGTPCGLDGRYHGRLESGMVLPVVTRLMTLDEYRLAQSDIKHRVVAPSVPAAVRKRELNAARAEWMAPVFVPGLAAQMHLTYSDEYGYSHGCMLPRNVLRDFSRFLGRLGRRGSDYLVGVEVHPQTHRTVLHLHAVVGGVWTRNNLVDAATLWSGTRGYCRIQQVLDDNWSLRYTMKHAAKQGREDSLFWQRRLAPTPSRHSRRVAARCGQVEG